MPTICEFKKFSAGILLGAIEG